MLETIERYRVPVAEAIDKSDKAINLAMKAGIAYYGWKAMNHLGGSLIGLIGFELAKSKNMIGGAAGVGILAAIGLTQVVEHSALATGQIPDSWFKKIAPQMITPSRLGEWPYRIGTYEELHGKLP